MTHWTPRAANQLGAPAPPELGTITLQPSGMVSFEFSALPDRAYRVDYTDDLGAPAWTPLSLRHATSARTLIITDNPAVQAQRYYRAILLQ